MNRIRTGSSRIHEISLQNHFLAFHIATRRGLRYAIRTRTEALDTVEATSVESLIKTKNTHPLRTKLPAQRAAVGRLEEGR